MLFSSLMDRSVANMAVVGSEWEGVPKGAERKDPMTACWVAMAELIKEVWEGSERMFWFMILFSRSGEVCQMGM